jgi:hypothetical protein
VTSPTPPLASVLSQLVLRTPRTTGAHGGSCSTLHQVGSCTFMFRWQVCLPGTSQTISGCPGRGGCTAVEGAALHSPRCGLASILPVCVGTGSACVDTGSTCVCVGGRGTTLEGATKQTASQVVGVCGGRRGSGGSCSTQHQVDTSLGVVGKAARARGLHYVPGICMCRTLASRPASQPARLSHKQCVHVGGGGAQPEGAGLHNTKFIT